MSSFLNWLLSPFAESVDADDVLILRPTAAAQQPVAGFRGGKDLTVRPQVKGETVKDLLGRLNVYRGPDQQLLRVWNPETGLELSGTTVVRGTVIAEVRPESI